MGGHVTQQRDDAYCAYADRIVHSASRQEFDLATLRFIASLHNGHTQFFDSQADGRPLKFRLLEVEGRWVVIGSQESRLPRGAIVRTIDGIPAEAFVHDKAPYVAASNDRIARTYVFLYLALFGERIALGLDNGQTVVIDRATPPNAPLAAGRGRRLHSSVIIR